MSTSSSAASTFSGQSQFAASLQQVITRAVGIASLPLGSLNVTLNTFNGEKSGLQGLDAAFSTLQSSISTIQAALTSGTLTSSVSDASIAGATLGSGAVPGTYSIEVDSLGASSTALSNTGVVAVTDPTAQGISSSTSLTLNVDGVPTTITPASSSLNDLASAINLQAAGQVQASVINVGSTASPDYRLSLTATKLGSLSIDLTDSSGTSLIQETNAGSPATYKVAGLSTELSSDSRTVTLAPGLTVDLRGQSASGQATTVTVANDPSAVASALSSFAGSYNAAVSLLAQYHGTAGGALQGDSIVNTLTSLLQQISGFSNGTPDTSLAAYGITVDQTGNLSVDTAALTTAANRNFAAFSSVLGGATTGGFLQSATNLLNSVEDSTTGTVKTELATVANEITAQKTKIADQQTRISQLQSNITAQIVKADAAIAALESQVSYVNGLFYSITGNNNNPSASATTG